MQYVRFCVRTCVCAGERVYLFHPDHNVYKHDLCWCYWRKQMHVCMYVVYLLSKFICFTFPYLFDLALRFFAIGVKNISFLFSPLSSWFENLEMLQELFPSDLSLRNWFRILSVCWRFSSSCFESFILNYSADLKTDSQYISLHILTFTIFLI